MPSPEEWRENLERIRSCNLVLMGEAPGNYPAYDPAKHALFPYPPRCAGARLKDLMGMALSEYVALDRRNLLDFYPGKQGKGAKFPKDAAKEAVSVLRDTHALIGRNVLFVGKRVAQAFGYGDDELLTWHRHKAYNRATVPHPSGVNKWWNDSQNRERGEDFLRRVAEQARKGALSFE